MANIRTEASRWYSEASKRISKESVILEVGTERNIKAETTYAAAAELYDDDDNGVDL